MQAIRAALGFGLSAVALHSVLAIDVPQNRQEFVIAVAAGAGATKMERFTVERPFDEVYADLEALAPSCLDVEVRRSGFVGTHVEVSSSDYTPQVRKVGAGRGEFTLQVAHRPRGVGHTPPPGGLYVMAADLEAKSAGQTDVVLYRPTIGFKPITRSLTEWLTGEGSDCPKLR